MPSDTAFAPDLRAAGALTNAYDSLGGTIDTYPKDPIEPLGHMAFSPRLLSGTIENLRSLGIDVDENNKVLRGLRAGVITGHSLYMLYGAVAALRRAEAAKEKAIAAGETTALAVAQQWHAIAQGAAAALLVAGAFAVGGKFGSGDWKFPSVDTSNPASRRNAARNLHTIR